MDKFDLNEVLRSVSYAFGINKLASFLGIQTGTLYNKINQNDSSSHHKVTLSEFIQIMTVTGKKEPLEALCGLMGGVFVQLPDLSDLSDQALLDIVNRVHISGGQVHKEIFDALEDGTVTFLEARACDLAFKKWLAAILELRGRINGMVVINCKH